MAKKNPGDILTCDWNPVIGCRPYSPGCKNCWFMSGIFAWQRRLGLIPEYMTANKQNVFENRLTAKSLRPKKGIVGVVQHGDLFCDWDSRPEFRMGLSHASVVAEVLEIVDQVAQKREDQTKYVLWTKRADRMVAVLKGRYPGIVPAHWGCAVSVEDQRTADERLPHLVQLFATKILAIEPMLGPITLAAEHLKKLQWIVVGSETGPDARPLELDWVRAVRDQAVNAKIPFFIKQLGNNHKKPLRELDGRTWDEFPRGYVK